MYFYPNVTDVKSKTSVALSDVGKDLRPTVWRMADTRKDGRPTNI